jgi:membrane protein implicated in regulation of membrane protease activity
MHKGNPHLLSITIGGCLLVVGALAAGALSGSLIVFGLAFAALLVVTASIVETLIRAFGDPEDAPPVSSGDDHQSNPMTAA